MIYQRLIHDPVQIISLYEANQWTAYIKQKDQLLQGLAQSLYCYGAYDENQLVGLIRVVGDGTTIIYIQDILVHPTYHRRGIGHTLMEHILERYSHVRQIVLTTDQTEVQQAFYESMGFKSYQSVGLTGYYLKK